MWDSLPTILNNSPPNKVHYRASPEAYGALEQPPLNRGSTPFSRALEQSTPFVRHLVTFDYTFEAHHFFVRNLRILLTWLS